MESGAIQQFSRPYAKFGLRFSGFCDPSGLLVLACSLPSSSGLLAWLVMAGLLDEELESAAAAADFKSSRGCKVPWRFQDVQALARVIHETLPQQVHDLVAGPDYKGGAIVNLDSVIQSPTRQHLRKNVYWIKPIVGIFQRSVPSGYFLCDALMELDKLMNKKLLQPKSGDKLTLALQEASKLKKLVGHLRYLYRNTSNSHSEEIAMLKGLLLKRVPKGVKAHPADSDCEGLDAEDGEDGDEPVEEPGEHEGMQIEPDEACEDEAALMETCAMLGLDEPDEEDGTFELTCDILGLGGAASASDAEPVLKEPRVMDALRAPFPARPACVDQVEAELRETPPRAPDRTELQTGGKQPVKKQTLKKTKKGQGGISQGGKASFRVNKSRAPAPPDSAGDTAGQPSSSRDTAGQPGSSRDTAGLDDMTQRVMEIDGFPLDAYPTDVKRVGQLSYTVETPMEHGAGRIEVQMRNRKFVVMSVPGVPMPSKRNYGWGSDVAAAWAATVKAMAG